MKEKTCTGLTTALAQSL